MSWGGKLKFIALFISANTQKRMTDQKSAHRMLACWHTLGRVGRALLRCAACATQNPCGWSPRNHAEKRALLDAPTPTSH